IVLLDEPTSALDVGHQQEVLELVAALRRDERLTVISAMHDLTLAGQFADRVVLLAGGRSIVAGPPREVLTEQAINHHYRASFKVRDGGGRGVVGPPRREAPAPLPEEGRIPVPVEAPAEPKRRRARSLVVVNTGDGKGKSTAAFGIVMRAVARDWRVIVI